MTPVRRVSMGGDRPWRPWTLGVGVRTGTDSWQTHLRPQAPPEVRTAHMHVQEDITPWDLPQP